MDTAFVTVWWIAGITAGAAVALILVLLCVALVRFIWDILNDL